MPTRSADKRRGEQRAGTLVSVIALVFLCLVLLVLWLTEGWVPLADLTGS